MTYTDSTPFMDLAPAVSLRENDRGARLESGWHPQWHQPTDLDTTYGDKNVLLGPNAAQTTFSATARLAGEPLR